MVDLKVDKLERVVVGEDELYVLVRVRKDTDHHVCLSMRFSISVR